VRRRKSCFLLNCLSTGRTLMGDRKCRLAAGWAGRCRGASLSPVTACVCESPSSVAEAAVKTRPRRGTVRICLPLYCITEVEVQVKL
jgi:hypothetical protein